MIQETSVYRPIESLFCILVGAKYHFPLPAWESNPVHLYGGGPDIESVILFPTLCCIAVIHDVETHGVVISK